MLCIIIDKETNPTRKTSISTGVLKVALGEDVKPKLKTLKIV